MLPLNVMNVIAIATHPISEADVRSDRRLIVEKNPGVTAAAAHSATMKTTLNSDGACVTAPKSRGRGALVCSTLVTDEYSELGRAGE
jgi:hypothetical protein